MRATQIESGLPAVRGTTQAGVALAALALLLAMATTIRPCLAASPSQATFASPQDASRALVAAVGAQDERAMTQILGGGKALISAEDAAQDALDRQYFVQKYREMHRWSRSHDATATLIVGAENWAFPIPLVLENGVWRFRRDTVSTDRRERTGGNRDVQFTAHGRDACGKEYAQADSVSWLLLPYASHFGRRLGGRRLPRRIPLLWCNDLHSHAGWRSVRKGSRPRDDEGRRGDEQVSARQHLGAG